MTPSNDLRERLLADHRMMCTIRFFEERVLALRTSNDIVGSVHLCNGQEGVAAGACSMLEKRDALFSTYRGHGWALARGADPEKMFAELLGRQGGYNAGRGGSAYFSAPEIGFYGENSIVGAGAPIATGAALAARYDNSGRVAMTVFGDGAMNQGAVFESLNFAAAFKLPVIFICENNKYSELTPIDGMVGNPNLHERAAGLGLHGCRIDGNDTELVRSTVAEAAQRARDGEGPSLVEAMTQRIVGHYIGDPEQYRPKGEIEELMKVEPIGAVERRLIELGETADALQTAAHSIRDSIQAASEAALAQPLADASNPREHLYA